ncbi:MAG: YihY/virulence factor BrkB family protein [Melioribacteraceae bacterium]|nr:YihY/virulence factor BrkB family protein [Melioribacteraceae bacterium]MCF8265615.1 YihY/virulence factor BrkB family protein [Melioribacteraceae bacterium]MCF8413262.1 YihY/virulence factor BrkB family protein [Melioribacteraceae bacterium]MCF8431739.1 YihY/virulence factor BrkB family protein [Melioribacteraceae bacterium]
MSKFKFLRFVTKYISPNTFKKVLAFLKHYFGGLYHRADENHIFLSGGGIAFSIFVCTLPTALIAFWILGNILDEGSIEAQISTFISTFIPYPEYAGQAEEIILSRSREVIEYKNLAGYLGTIGLIFAASGLFSSLRTVLNRAYRVKMDKHIILGKLRDFGMILLVMVAVIFSTFVLPILNLLQDFASDFEFLKALELSTFMDSILSVVSVIILFVMFSLLYYLIPYEKLGKKVPMVSAFWAVFLWEVARQIFQYYLANFATLTKIYGTYALLVVIAFWLYYSSILFLIGAEIGQLYKERKIILQNEGELNVSK